MLILGIDPGTARLGYGLVEIKKLRNASFLRKAHKVQKAKIKNDGHLVFVDAGCLETVLETPMAARLLFLQDEVGKIIARYKPDVMAIESLFFGVNAKTAIAVGQARGVILAEAARYGVPVFEYQGLSVKFAVTGFGRSKKKEVQEGVRKILRMKSVIKPDDAADGLAIAITHHVKTAQQINKSKSQSPKSKPQ